MKKTAFYLILVALFLLTKSVTGETQSNLVLSNGTVVFDLNTHFPYLIITTVIGAIICLLSDYLLRAKNYKNGSTVFKLNIITLLLGAILLILLNDKFSALLAIVYLFFYLIVGWVIFGVMLILITNKKAYADEDLNDQSLN